MAISRVWHQLLCPRAASALAAAQTAPVIQLFCHHLRDQAQGSEPAMGTEGAALAGDALPSAPALQQHHSVQ